MEWVFRPANLVLAQPSPRANLACHPRSGCPSHNLIFVCDFGTTRHALAAFFKENDRINPLATGVQWSIGKEALVTYSLMNMRPPDEELCGQPSYAAVSIGTSM